MMVGSRARWCGLIALMAGVVLADRMDRTLNDRPVIGILTIPIVYSKDTPGQASYIAASYVKAVEQTGARTIPLPYDTPHDLLIRRLDRLSGVLFTGGGADLNHTQLTRTATTIIQYVLQANSRGSQIALLGVCLGLELITVILNTMDDVPILSNFNADDFAWPVKFDIPAPEGITFPRDDPLAPSIMSKLSSFNSTYHHHSFGVDPARFVAAIPPWLKIIATSVDANGYPFVSMFEGVGFPIFGWQFHPEKPLFEWDLELSIPHDVNSRDIGQYLYNRFVDTARECIHSFQDDDEKELSQLLMYNFIPTYSGLSGALLEQIYIFPAHGSKAQISIR